MHKHAKPDNPQLIAASLKLLAMRDMSRAAFERKLAAQAFSPADVAAAVAWCEAEGWLCESRYADAAAVRLGKKYAAGRVRQTLRQKGVEAEVAEAAVADLRTTDLDRARLLWQRRFGVSPGSAGERARQMRFLQARGFGFDVIRRVIDAASDGDTI